MALRLFIGLRPSPEALAPLAALQAELAAVPHAAKKLRLTVPENLHLTVRFELR